MAQRLHLRHNKTVCNRREQLELSELKLGGYIESHKEDQLISSERGTQNSGVVANLRLVCLNIYIVSKNQRFEL